MRALSVVVLALLAGCADRSSAAPWIFTSDTGERIEVASVVYDLELNLSATWWNATRAGSFPAGSYELNWSNAAGIRVEGRMHCEWSGRSVGVTGEHSSGTTSTYGTADGCLHEYSDRYGIEAHFFDWVATGWERGNGTMHVWLKVDRR